MLLQETKQVALATSETLANQTNQIGGMKGNVEEIDNQLKKSDQVCSWQSRLDTLRDMVSFLIL